MMREIRLEVNLYLKESSVHCWRDVNNKWLGGCGEVVPPCSVTQETGALSKTLANDKHCQLLRQKVT